MKNRTKLFLSLITFIICCFFISSCKTTENDYKPHTLLWSVEKNNKTLYLLGSVHIGSEDIYPLDKTIMKAFNQADVLGVEINPKNVNFLDMLSLFFDPLRDNSKLLSKETYNKIKELFASFNLNDEIIKKLKPVGIAILSEVSKFSKIAKTLKGIDSFDKSMASSLSTPGIDQYFLNLADSTGKEIYEIESVKRQLRVFEALEDVIEDYITETLSIDNTEKETMEVQTIMNAWKNGDIETLKKILDVDYTSNQKLNKRIKEELIIKRNKEMADNIEKILANEDKNYFIIVGAGHLVSEKNIIELLEKTGKYKIKRY